MLVPGGGLDRVAAVAAARSAALIGTLRRPALPRLRILVTAQGASFIRTERSVDERRHLLDRHPIHSGVVEAPFDHTLTGKLSEPVIGTDIRADVAVLAVIVLLVPLHAALELPGDAGLFRTPVVR